MSERRNLKICLSSTCKVDFPHNHVKAAGTPAGWGATIDDPVVPAPWPDRLHWKRPEPGLGYGRECANNGGNPYYLFKYGWFASHSGFQLPWKIDCEDGFDDGDWEALASIIAAKIPFRSVYGIPKGGVKLAEQLDKYCEPGFPVLIVDDVLTTGRSFVEARAKLGNPEDCIGVVVFARGVCPNWIFPIVTVNEFFQCRATGLG